MLYKSHIFYCRRTRHPHIVMLMAVGVKGEETWLVMQFVAGKNLHDVIFKVGF